jgi:hypothetical protein
MTSLKIAAAAAAVFAGLSSPAFAESFSALSAPGFTTETTSLVDQYLMPEAPAGSTITSYSVLSTAAGFSTTGTLTFAAPVTSYTFLWGSPDSYNSVSDGKVSVSGSSLGSGSGNNADTTLYTFLDLSGFTTLTFKTTGIAFELATVSPVPEPGTYALLLAGLGVVGFSTRRRML